MKIKRDGGFWLCFLVNLVFRAEWLIFAITALILNMSIGFPSIGVFWILLVLWIVISLFLTLIFSYTSKIGNKKEPSTENKNPYSKKTEDYLPDENKSE